MVDIKMKWRLGGPHLGIPQEKAVEGQNRSKSKQEIIRKKGRRLSPDSHRDNNEGSSSERLIG